MFLIGNIAIFGDCIKCQAEISEIFDEISEILTEILKACEISTEITKSRLKSRIIICKMGGEVGVFSFFTHAHSIFEVPECTWRGSATYPPCHGTGPYCFPTFTLCSHVVFLHEFTSKVSCSMEYG